MEYSRSERYWIWLSSIEGIGIKRFEQLREMFEDPYEVFSLAEKKNEKAFAFLSEVMRKRLYEHACESYIDTFFEKLEKNQISAITKESSGYPEILLQIYDPPTILYSKGKMNLTPQMPIAMVGTRSCTGYGASVAHNLAKTLTERGATIVSGLARGIDSWAHKGALEAENSQAPTIAVLGCGVDIIYPAGNEELYEKILDRGAIVSEFTPSTPPVPGNFPVRNRIISGLSRGVVVVEAGERSGTLITVNYALDQGRDVFAVPGRITDSASYGTNRLIRESGAKPVFCPEDILEEYGFSIQPGMPKTLDLSGLGTEETLICMLLQSGERSFDELCELMSISVRQLNSTLTSLEFRGIIKQLPGKVFCLEN